MINYAPTITSGDLFQALALVISVFSIYNRLSIKLNTLETKLDPIYQWWIDQKERQHKQFGD